MEKINFVNQSTPALNATNLNKLQDNVEDAIQEVQDVVDIKLNADSVKTTQTNSDTDTYSCNYLNRIDLIGKTITMNSGDETTQDIPINTQSIVQNTSNEAFNQFENDEITYSNGIYTINSDKIHTVLVNAQTFWNTTNSNFIYVIKNDLALFAKTADYTRNQIAFVLNVQKNDKIKIGCYTTTSNVKLRADINNMSQITVLG